MKLYKLKAKDDTTQTMTKILTTKPQISLFLLFVNKVDPVIGSSNHSLKIKEINPSMKRATTKY